MTDVEQQKKQIYDLLFYNWNPDTKSQVRGEIMSLIQNSFGTREKQSMPLAELNFNIQYTRVITILMPMYWIIFIIFLMYSPS